MIALLSASITRSNRVGLNYKKAIIDINGREMIPLLISTYNKEHKDHDILTLLMILMKNNEYPPFLSSSSYKKIVRERRNQLRGILKLQCRQRGIDY